MRFSIVIGMLTIRYVELFFTNEFLPIELESVFYLFNELVVGRQFLALEQQSVSRS